MTFWKELLNHLQSGSSAALLCVLHSEGSSPGRQGFKMFVTDEAVMHGTVGGGIMEQKLVELAKSKLAEGEFDPFIKRQVHSPDEPKDRSGMICSGEQTLAFYYLDQNHISLIRQIISDISQSVIFENNGIRLADGDKGASRFHLHTLTENEWKLEEQLNFINTAYIFGGGHVGLAMSQTMSQIGFRVVVFDDREGLNTLEQNRFADEIKIIDYNESEKHVEEGESSYVIIMSFGYKPDEVIIRRLLGMDFKYIGMMGSQKKIDTMWEKLRADGFSEEELSNVHAPIGLPIHSKTTDEIAISIAAQIIEIKNRDNPSMRED